MQLNLNMEWAPSTGTIAGTATGWSMTSSGTVSHPALASTNFQTQARRTRFASATTANAKAGLVTTDAVCWRGNANNVGGFSFSTRFSMSTNVAASRAFVGLSASSASLVAAEPSSFANSIGIGFDSADSSTGNWFLMRRDAASGVKEALGATTVAAGSNGQALAQATINVAATSGFPRAGTLAVTTSSGTQTVAYTGLTATTFTGCTGGAGTLSTGGVVALGRTTIAVASNGLVLPQATINVASTLGFASSGTVFVTTANGTQAVAYTGTSGGNSFIGCAGGTGAMSTGGAVTASSAARSTSDVYDLTISAGPGAAGVAVLLINVTTGTTIVDNVLFGTNLPSSSAFLYAHAELGPAAAASATQLELAGMSLLEQRGSSVASPSTAVLAGFASIAALQAAAGGFLAGEPARVVGTTDGGGQDFYFEGVPPAAAAITAATTFVSTVTGASNTTPIVVTTSAAHGLVNGQSILISGVLGNTAANGRWLLTVIAATTFSLTNSTGNGAWIAGGTQRASSVVVTTAAPHGLVAGQRVMVGGATGTSGFSIDGSFVPIGTATTTAFSIPCATTGSYAAGGAVGNGATSIPSTAVTGRWIRVGDPVFFYANEYGCIGDGVADDTAALNALLTLASQDSGGSTLQKGIGGRVVVFPNNATYKCSGLLSMNYRNGLTLRGPAKIHYTGAGNSTFFSILSCASLVFEDIHFTYSSPSFSGHIVGTQYGTPVSDNAYLTWNRCSFYGTSDALGEHGARSCLSLKNVIDVRIHDCIFTAALIGIDGYSVAVGDVGFANTVLIDGCVFNKIGNGVPTVGVANGCASIKNPGECWSIVSNTFEPLQGAGFIEVSMNAIWQVDDYFSWALHVAGNWMGDGAGEGPWINGLKCLGASITGNMISGANSVVLFKGCNGVHFSGNRVSGAVEFALDSTGHYSAGVVIAGNTIQAATPYVGLQFVSVPWLFGNEDTTGLAGQLPVPVAIGDRGAVYNRIELSGATWDPDTVAATSHKVSPDLTFSGCLLGQTLSLGVSPAAPDGVLVTAAITADNVVRVSAWNFNTTPWIPGTLTLKFHGLS